jgi:long-subunit acyl-CoA synthetase (AMP-forming)
VRSFTHPEGTTVHASFQTLSHFSEYIVLPGVLLHGGAIGFVNPTTLSQDLKALEPSFINAVPRIFNVPYALFEAELAEKIQRLSPSVEREKQCQLIEQQLLQDYSSFYGPNITFLAIGSAPVSIAVRVIECLLLTFSRLCVL